MPEVSGEPSAAEHALLTSIVTATRERLAAAACSIALLEADELVFRVADGAGADQVVGVRLPLGRGIAGWVVASGQAIAVADVHRDQRFDAETAASTGYVPSTILAVPIEDDDGPLGVLEVLDRGTDAHDLQIAAAAARQAGLALEVARRRTEIDAVLADPQLTALLGLVRRLGGASEQDRALAMALLQAVLDHRKVS